jgi:hypothetical protein
MALSIQACDNKSYQGEQWQKEKKIRNVGCWNFKQKRNKDWTCWHMPIIPATQEAEIGRIMV